MICILAKWAKVKIQFFKGIANALGNKGAVAVSFQFGGTSFCFINAHLTSGSEKCVRYAFVLELAFLSQGFAK